MTHNLYLEAVYSSQFDYNFSNANNLSVPNHHEEHLSTFPAPPQAAERQPSSIQVTNSQHANHYSAHNGVYNTPTTISIANDTAPCEPSDNDPYHVPNYFGLTEYPIDTKDETKLEFDPPLIHYAELRGGLPIGYVWLPPSSLEPMPREATPALDPDVVTPQRAGRRVGSDGKGKRSGEFAGLLQKKMEKVGVEGLRARLTSPLSEELSDAPSGLLTEDTEELSDAPRGLLTSEEEEEPEMSD